MTQYRRTRNWQIVADCAVSVSLFVTIVCGLLMCLSTDSLAQDAGLESLKQQPLPWYDAASEQIKPVELEAREEPRSALRGTIAKKPPAPPKEFQLVLPRGFRDISLLAFLDCTRRCIRHSDRLVCQKH